MVSLIFHGARARVKGECKKGSAPLMNGERNDWERIRCPNAVEFSSAVVLRPTAISSSSVTSIQRSML